MTLSSFSNNDFNSAHAESEVATQVNDKNRGLLILQRLWQWIGVKDKTLWDYLQLMIVPLLLIFVTTGISQYQKSIDDARADKEKQAAETKTKQDTLNSYIDAMTDLMKSGLGKQSDEGERLQPIATSRTILTLRELDGSRNMIVLGFLKESNLIRRDPQTEEDQKKEYEKQQAQYGQCLTNKAKAKTKVGNCLPPSPLFTLDLGESDLSNVNFNKVDLNTLNLKGASLKNAILTKAILIDTNLEEADLTGADLTGANLTSANLKNARLPKEHLLKNVKYCDTTMPDGNKKNDHCSFIPQPGSQYKVVVGNSSGTSIAGWFIRAYRDPMIRGKKTSVKVPHGTTVTLTGDYLVKDEDTWVKIKDEGSVGGWVRTRYLVPAEIAK